MQKLVEDLQAEISNLRAQVNSGRPTAPKDFSLIFLIPKWSGTENSVSVKEFFESVESVATIGNLSLRLPEFDFEIEHVPGSKIEHVDALSRHVGLVEETQLMSKELMIREQKKDPFCKEQTQNRPTANSEYFLDMDGVLYRRVKGEQPKLVVPESLKQNVIAENHNPIFVAHPGGKRTFELISLKYWWPKMRQSIEHYVRRCDKCQTWKGKHEF